MNLIFHNSSAPPNIQVSLAPLPICSITLKLTFVYFSVAYKLSSEELFTFIIVSSSCLSKLKTTNDAKTKQTLSMRKDLLANGIVFFISKRD